MSLQSKKPNCRAMLEMHSPSRTTWVMGMSGSVAPDDGSPAVALPVSYCRAAVPINPRLRSKSRQVPVTASLYTDVDRFADLLARLDDPFAHRAAVLRRAGLDDAACQKLRERWAMTFTQAEGGPAALAERFGAAYARARSALVEARQSGTELVD